MSYVPRNATLDDPVYVHSYSENAIGLQYHGMRGSAPSSGAWPANNRIFFVPFYMSKPFSLARWFWLNGATVGTDYLQAGIYDKDFNLFRASPRTLSAGTASQVQYATPGIHGTHLFSSGLNAAQTSYTTASTTLKAGVLYLIVVVNSKATNADTITSITGGGTWTSRSTTQFGASNARCISIWSCVPTSDYTGTLVIDYGANTQTSAGWSVEAFYHVNTATTHGIVQNAVGTGTSATPLATLAAFGSTDNGTFGAFGNLVAGSGAPSTGYVELNDSTVAGPGIGMQSVFRPDNDTTVDETITSTAWGACAVEIKSLGTGAVYVPPMRGWMALHCNGTTATTFRKTAWTELAGPVYLQSAATAGFPQTATPATQSGSAVVPVFGFTRRATV